MHLIVRNNLQVGAQTQVELKDKQLRIEDALNATKVLVAFSQYFSVVVIVGQ